MQKVQQNRTTLDDVERKQDEFSSVTAALKNYTPRDNKYVKAKNKLLNNAKNFYERREKIIERFKNEVFPFCYDEKYEEKMKAEREIEEERARRRKKRKEKKEKQKKQEEQKEESETNKFSKYIENKSTGISYDLFKNYFDFETPTQLTKNLFEIKDRKKNNDFVEEVKKRWSKLKDDIEEMSEDEKKLRSQIKYQNLFKRFLCLMNKINKEKF